MFKTFTFIAIFLFWCLQLFGDNLNSVDKIIEQHLFASGGQQNLETLKSITRIGKIFFVNYGQPKPVGWLTYRTDLIYSTQLREKLQSADFLLDDGKDFDVYWKFDGKNYVDIKDPIEKNHLLETAKNANRELLNIKKDYPDIEVASTEPTWAINSICLTAKKDKKMFFHCFDKKTHLLSAKGSDEEYRLTRDWREAGGIKIPFRLMHFKEGKLMYKVELEKVMVNSPVDRSRFVIPKK